MRVLKGDELLFLLHWCSGSIGAKLGVPVAGTFKLLLYRFLDGVGVAAPAWRGK